ncbi:helix-turn-helix transcriptional regulator [Nitrosomonas sp.]|uniref:helix-turn-helix transcriptional regulator n=1 Tax=Nitrosomonas sp. TaxID=42353 RepID=UPI0035244198
MTKIIRMNQLVKMLGVSRSSIHRFQAQGDFVPKIRIGTRSVGYSEAALEEWIKNREAKESEK